MRLLVLFLTLCISSISYGKQWRIAVVDTGFSGERSKLCATGQYDFTNNTPTVGIDRRGHGTEVVNTIELYGGYSSDYCFMIYKVFDTGPAHAPDLAKAILQAVKDGANILNLSYSGTDASDEEHEALRKAVRFDVRVFAAAGNEGHNLDTKCDAYPACYKTPGVFVVGSVDDNAVRHGNYGAVVDEDEPWCKGKFCGTSASTAIATGKYLKDRLD